MELLASISYVDMGVDAVDAGVAVEKGVQQRFADLVKAHIREQFDAGGFEGFAIGGRCEGGGGLSGQFIQISKKIR